MNRLINSYINKYIYDFIYIIPRKFFGILTTSYRRQEEKTAEKQQKRRILAKIHPKSKENFAQMASVVFWLTVQQFFFPDMVHKR